MPSRLQDVAKMAGVSVATASRYINKSGFVSKQAGERLQSAIESLSYLPDVAAGSLVTGRSRLVAVLVPVLAQSMFNQTIEALIRALAADGYTAMLGLTGHNDSELKTVLNAALARRAEAIILTGILSDASLRERLRNCGTTVIETWGLPQEPIDVAVGFSHQAAGRAIARYLSDRGYRRPYLLTTMGSRAVLRRAGFLEEWSASRDSPVVEAEIDNPSRFSQARGIFRDIRMMSERPDVVICGSDGLAQGIAIEALSAGLKVPDDLAVVGFGDIAVAADMRPSLTTVAVDGMHIGQEAANVLRLRARGEDPQNRRIDIGFRLIERESA